MPTKKESTRFKYSTVEVKTDCHSFHPDYKKCMALTNTFCKKELCSFYISNEEYEAKEKKMKPILKKYMTMNKYQN